MIKVAFIGFLQTQDEVNGVTFAAHNLCLGLNKIGVKVYFYGISHKTHSYEEDGKIFRQFKKARFPLKISKKFSYFLKENPDDIDVFHFHSVFIPFFVPVQKILKAKEIPYVITPHGGYEQSILKKNRILKHIYLKFYERNLVRNAERIICVSEHEVENVKFITREAMSEIIYNPVVINEGNKDHPVLECKNQVLVYLGRYNIPHKGLAKLLMIFKKVEEKASNVELRMYGAGNDRPKLESMVKSLNLKQVKIEGPVYGDKKIQILKNATAYVQMSNWETFGISIVEAMMLGKTIILNSGCALSRHLVDAKAGLIVDNNDANAAAERIIDYLSNKNKLLSDGLILKDLAFQKFSISKIANKTYQLYLELLNEQKFIKKEAFSFSHY